LLDILPVARNVSVIVLMVIGVAGVWQSLKADKHIVNCACLGSLIKLPLSKLTLYEDTTMAVLAGLMLAFGGGS